MVAAVDFLNKRGMFSSKIWKVILLWNWQIWSKDAPTHPYILEANHLRVGNEPSNEGFKLFQNTWLFSHPHDVRKLVVDALKSKSPSDKELAIIREFSVDIKWGCGYSNFKAYNREFCMIESVGVNNLVKLYFNLGDIEMGHIEISKQL